MIHKLINMLNISLYSEHDFFINKLDETHFSVKARNGLKATITINDRVMFVDISFQYDNPSILWSTSLSKLEEKVVRYSTPMNESLLSFDDFVVEAIKNTILFKLKKNRLSTYFKEYDDFFKNLEPVARFHQLINDDLEIIRYLNDDEHCRYLEKETPEYHCFYTYKLLDENCYPIINFHKKKVIDNVFQYRFQATKINKKAKKEKVVAYYIDGVFFNLCDLETFFFHKAAKDNSDPFGIHSFNFNQYRGSDPKILYGINDQLTAHQSFLSTHIDLTKIQVLRRDGQQYCLLKKENRQLTLSYITNFDIKKTVVDGVLTYSSWWQKMLRNETPLRRYKNEHLITYTYLDGKLTKKTERFDLDMVTKHEMDISNQVMTNADYLKTHYPSDFIVNRLNEFGICSDIPLSLDDLAVLEMCEI